MPKTKKKQPVSYQTILWSVIVALVIVCGVLAVALFNKSTARTSYAEDPANVSLGSMQYHFTDSKAIKRSDASVNILKEFLENKAMREGCSVQTPAYEHVVAYTKDETQIYLKYGCGAADSPMYAVKTNGAWETLSPTNHFDYLGLPDCHYVTENNISREIAPVCANTVQAGSPNGAPAYSVR